MDFNNYRFIIKQKILIVSLS